MPSILQSLAADILGRPLKNFYKHPQIEVHHSCIICCRPQAI